MGSHNGKKYKVIIADAISFRFEVQDDVGVLENAVQRRYVLDQNKYICNYWGQSEDVPLHGDIKYISNYGLLMLGNMLKQLDNLEISYTNGDYFNNEEEYIQHLCNNYGDYDFACFTTTTPQSNHVLRIAERLKKLNSNIIIIVGGPHMRYYIRENPPEYIDHVCIGYDLQITVDLIKDIIAGRKRDQKIEAIGFTDSRKAFDLIPEDKRQETLYYNHFSMGCPNQCKYCVEHKVCDQVQYLDIVKKMDEVEWLIKTYNLKCIHFSDSDFLLNHEFFGKIVNELERRNIKCTYTINTSPTCLTKQINSLELKKFIELGLIEILIGAEHFSDNVRMKVSKKYNLDEFEKALYKLKYQLKLPIISLYSMVGLPNEFDEDIEINVSTFKRFKKEGLFDYSFPKFFVPYPDSDIYLYPEKYGVEILSNNFDDFHRWRTPRPIKIIGMEDMKYLQEIKDIIILNCDLNENDFEGAKVNKFYI